MSEMNIGCHHQYCRCNQSQQKPVLYHSASGTGDSGNRGPQQERDINEKQGTKINAKLLSEKLGCPVIETVSTANRGLGEVIKAAAALNGKGQKAPYLQADIDLTDKVGGGC